MEASDKASSLFLLGQTWQFVHEFPLETLAHPEFPLETLSSLPFLGTIDSELIYSNFSP